MFLRVVRYASFGRVCTTCAFGGITGGFGLQQKLILSNSYPIRDPY